MFVSRARLDSWLEAVPAARHRFVLGLGPLAEVPEGYPDGTSYREWAGIAQGIADSLGLRSGDRLLVDAGRHEQPVAWLLAPLVAGASVVLCANVGKDVLDAAVREENATHVL